MFLVVERYAWPQQMSDGAMSDVITHVRHPGRGLQLRLANVICASSSADLFSFSLKKNFTRY